MIASDNKCSLRRMRMRMRMRGRASKKQSRWVEYFVWSLIATGSGYFLWKIFTSQTP